MADNNQVPKGAKRKVTLDTGRILYFREPKFSDVRQASQIATSPQGAFDSMVCAQELVQLLCVGVKRKNGEYVDITNKDKFFDEILSFDEASQILQNPDVIGLDLKKKPPEVEKLY